MRVPDATAVRCLIVPRQPDIGMTQGDVSGSGQLEGQDGPTFQRTYNLRKKVLKDSGMLQWFEEAGIPYDPAPRRRMNHDGSETETWLTASNVKEEELIKTYRWQFYSTRVTGGTQGVSEIGASIYFILEAKDSYVDKGALKIPDEWMDAEEEAHKGWSPMDLVRRSLLVYARHANAIALTQYGPSSTRHPLPFDLDRRPLPDMMPDLNKYSRREDPDATASIEWAMLKFLGFPRTDDMVMDISIERHVGANIGYVLNIPGCTRSSSAMLKYPTALGCFGSYSSPGIACQISADKLPGLKYCRPLVFAGEAVSKGSTAASGLPSVAAELACAVQPTLQLFIIDLVTRYMNADKTWAAEWNPLDGAQIPEHMFVFGLSYDKAGITIYAFFPRYEIRNGKVIWGFECRKVQDRYNYHFPVTHTVLLRAEILRTLVAILAWGDSLVEKLTGADQLRSPPELIKLDQEWDSVA